MLDLYKGETKRPYSFTSGLDLDGQILQAEAYAEDGTSYPLNSDGVTAVGNGPDIETVIYVKSPDSMPVGVYAIKIFTDEVVVSKDRLRHYGDNPFEF